MNLFNRMFLILLLLALAGFAIALIVLAWTIPNSSIAWLRDAVQWMAEHNQDEEKAILSAVAGAIAFVAFILVIIELLPRSPTEVRVTDLKVGDAAVSTAAIGQRIEEAVTQVPHVQDVKAYVKSKRKGVNVALDLHVDPEANLATVTDQACDVTREVLANRVHVALTEGPSVKLHYRELRLNRRAAMSRQPVSSGSTALPAGATTVAEPPTTEAKVVETVPYDTDGEAVFSPVEDNGADEEVSISDEDRRRRDEAREDA